MLKLVTDVRVFGAMSLQEAVDSYGGDTVADAVQLKYLKESVVEGEKLLSLRWKGRIEAGLEGGYHPTDSALFNGLALRYAALKLHKEGYTISLPVKHTVEAVREGEKIIVVARYSSHTSMSLRRIYHRYILEEKYDKIIVFVPNFRKLRSYFKDERSIFDVNKIEAHPVPKYKKSRRKADFWRIINTNPELEKA